MRGRIQKWGNSLAIRIPKAIASEASIDRNSEVEIRLEDGGIVVRPIAREYSLDELLDGVTPENLHREIGSGPQQGREEW